MPRCAPGGSREQRGIRTASDPRFMHISVARALGIELVEGRWTPGEARTLSALQCRFSVSRTIAREAGRRLESLGMVEARRRVGLVALPCGSWNTWGTEVIDWALISSVRGRQVESLGELYVAVGPAAAENTARSATAGTRRRIAALAEACISKVSIAPSSDAALTGDIALQSALFESCGNGMYRWIAAYVAPVLSEWPRREGGSTVSVGEFVAAREALARGVVEANPGLAALAMRSIVSEVRSPGVRGSK